MRQIILFGGSFDPVHHGHLEIAKAALKQTKSDGLWFVLAAKSPFKDDGTSYGHRRKMLEMMISYHQKMQICDIEHYLPKPSYSIDTVKALRKQNPNTEFLWLIGSDHIPTLHKWKDFNQLNQLVKFIVYDRPLENHDHPYLKIEGQFKNVSSTEIRKGKSTNTSPQVLNYMMHKGLYLDEMIKTRLSDFRYQHTLRVKDVALEIAKSQNLDEERMYLAAMMHDFAKEDTIESLQSNVKSMDAQFLKLPKAFYHAFAARKILSKNYYIKDRWVLKAIQGHVNGANKNPYAMTLYIADKCEPGRNYPSQHLIALAKQDLVKAFNRVKKEQIEYLKETL